MINSETNEKFAKIIKLCKEKDFFSLDNFIKKENISSLDMAYFFVYIDDKLIEVQKKLGDFDDLYNVHIKYENADVCEFLNSYDCVIKNLVDIIRIFLKNGMNPNEQHYYFRKKYKRHFSILECVSQIIIMGNGDISALKLLFEAGADPNLQTEDGALNWFADIIYCDFESEFYYYYTFGEYNKLVQVCLLWIAYGAQPTECADFRIEMKNGYSKEFLKNIDDFDFVFHKDKMRIEKILRRSSGELVADFYI